MSMNLKLKKGLRPATSLNCGPGRTKQSFKDETDINKIVAKYVKTGLMDYVNKNPGTYSDVSDVANFQDSLNIVRKGRELFDALPADLREEFANDPARLIAFLDDPKNLDKAVELGLVKKPKKPASPAAGVKKPDPKPPAKPKTDEKDK